jgi:hypothetical protein
MARSRGRIMLEDVDRLAPRKRTFEQAARMIAAAHHCAVGTRICRAVRPEAPLTRAVFLDALAEEMARAGKARTVTAAEAIANLSAYRKHPIVASRVSGNYAEICPTRAKKCLYWNMEKHKRKCIRR